MIVVGLVVREEGVKYSLFEGFLCCLLICFVLLWLFVFFVCIMLSQ